jgi:DNA-binding protein YbaB
MSTPLQDRLEAALENLRGQQAKVRAFQEEMKTRTTTVTSKNRMVVATVDATGVLTELAFKGNRYRTMPPAELGALVTETVSAAQKEAKDKAMTAAAELMPRGTGLFGGQDPFGSGGGRDLDSMFKAAMDAGGIPVFEEQAGAPVTEGKEKK